MRGHPHIHMLVTGGCLSFDEKRWIAIGDNYLFDVRKISEEFKRRFTREIKMGVSEFTIPESSIQERNGVLFTLSDEEEIEQPEEERCIHSCPECAAAAMEIVDTLLPHGPPPIIFRNEASRG